MTDPTKASGSFAGRRIGPKPMMEPTLAYPTRPDRTAPSGARTSLVGLVPTGRLPDLTTSKESSNMPWTASSIASLPNIDLRYLAGDALNAQLNGMNPYGDKIVTAMYQECRKRGIKTILDDDGNVYPLVRLRVNEDVK